MNEIRNIGVGHDVATCCVIRKRMLSVALILLGLFPTAAPPVMGQGISLGFRAGLAVSGLIFEDPYASEQTLHRPGLQLGGFASTALTPSLSLEAGLKYIQKGFIDDGAHIGDVRSGYFEIPVVVRADVPWNVPPQVIVGVEVGRQISCSVTGVAVYESMPCDDPIAGMSYSQTDFGAILGFGGGIRLGNGTLILDATGALGLVDKNNDSFIPGRARDLTLSFTAGYRFGIRGDRNRQAD